MNRDLFGTDGVRGLAGEYPLDAEGAKRIGMAVGTHFAQPGQKIVIAGDPRESSAQIIQDITDGLKAVGIVVITVGVLPTPGLAYLTREHEEFVAGVMVTASHNPYQYNGVKVFDGNGDKLPDATEATLNQLITEGVPERPGGHSIAGNKFITEYEDFLVASAQGLQLTEFKVAIDAANGAASGIAERVFTRLGAQVTALSDKPDGRNINDHCGATDTKSLCQTVVSQQLAAGIAVDGDADRIMMVDAQGRELNGDYLMYLLAVSNMLGGVVATVMSNLGFEKALAQHGIKLERVKVGDRYVLEGLQKTDFELGGEQSGHMIFPELLATGDALLAAVQIVQVLHNTHKTLAEWRDEVTMLPQALVNLEVSDKSAMERPAIQQYIAEQIEALGDTGRILIRPSGTEPLVRVMVEAPQADELAHSIAEKLQELLA
jgi:phosphoglucosamine mutase